MTVCGSLAMMEMTLALAHFYRRFNVTLVDPKETMPLIQQFIMKPSKWIEPFEWKFYSASCLPNLFLKFLFRISAVERLFA